MSDEVPFVWYDPISGERNVIGKCIVEPDGSFTVNIDDELVIDAFHANMGPFSLDESPINDFSMWEKLRAEKFPEFQVKFDPGKFGIGPVDPDDPGKTLMSEVLENIRKELP